MILRLASLFLITLALAGCATVPMGDAGRDAELKNFRPKAGVAGLYIYRNESFGGAVSMDVEVDGRPIGQTGPQTCFYREVAPGKHTITSKAENTDTLEVETVAGTLYFIWQEVKMGFLFARTKLSLVGEEEGRKGVLESRLAAGQ